MKNVYRLLHLVFLYLLPYYTSAQISLPVSRIVFQRGTDNRANVPIEGTCPTNSTSIQAKATPINGGQAVDWTTVGNASNGSFSGQLSLVAGWYNLEIRSFANGAQTGSWSVDRVGVGEVLIVSGQSNAQGFQDGPDASDDRVSCVAAVNGSIREYQLAFQFQHLDGSATVGPTNNKHFYGALGDKLVQRFNCPVLLLGAAFGGTSSEQWAKTAQGILDVPDSQRWDGQESLQPYRALGVTLNHYARRTGLRGILWFQGESDKGKSGDTYYDNISYVINKARSDLGFSVPWVISQTSWIDGGGDENIRSAQRRLVSTISNCYAGPNTDNYGDAFRNPDRTHFSPGQMGLLADLWNQSLTDSFFSTGQPFRLSDLPATVTTALPAPARQYAGGHLYVSYMTSGPANGGVYSVQLLNESGGIISTIGSGTSNPLLVYLPTDANGTYRVRVVSSVSGNSSAPSEKFSVFQNGLSKGTGTGLTGAYYPNQDLAGSPVITRIDSPLDLTWIGQVGPGMPSDNRNWSARWTGQIEAPVSGSYQFKVFYDDGVRVWINNTQLIDDWTVHPWSVARYAQINLDGGKRYDIKLEIRQDWFAAELKLLWILPGQNQSQYVPTDRLYPTGTSQQAPTVTGSLPALNGTRGTAISYSANVFQDPAGLTLTYAYAGLPPGLTGSPSSLAITGTPTNSASGTFTVTAKNSAGLSTSTAGTWTITEPSSSDALALIAPVYNCTTGAITFKTSGGNGSTIEYMAGGITGWTTNPNQYLDSDARTANDTPPFTLYARQSGTTVSYSWSRQQTCNGTPPPPPPPPQPTAPTVTGSLPTLSGTRGTAISYSANVFQDPGGLTLTYAYAGLPPGLTGSPSSLAITGTPTNSASGTFTITAKNSAGLSTSTAGTWTITEPSSSDALTLIAPVYNCTTGAITFKTSGGNGSTIEYMAGGITGWTTNPNQYLDSDARTANDTPPFTLYARQSGTTVSYSWSRQQTCNGTPPPPPPPPQPTAPTVTGSLPALNGTRGTAISYSANVFQDPAGLTLTYAYAGLPPGLTGSPSSLAITGTPTNSASGTFTVTAKNSAGLSTSTAGTWTITEPSSSDALALIAPVYNCTTGAITFKTSGGNGSTIEYMAGGITGWTTNPNQYLDSDARTANDTPPFTLYARQSGTTVSYSWSRQQTCNGTPPPPPPPPQPTAPTVTGSLPTLSGTRGTAISYSANVFQDPGGLTLTYAYAGLPPGLTGSPSSLAITGTPTNSASGTFTVTAKNSAGLSTSTAGTWTINEPSSGDALALIAPVYNCASGAITFKTSGGNGSTIEYMAGGITGWTTNPNQYLDSDARTANDTPPFTLYARQSGTTVSYSWSRQQACGTARKAVDEKQDGWSLYPNPVGEITTLRVPESIDPTTLRLSLFSALGSSIDLTGKTSVQQHAIQIRLADYSSLFGLYFLKVDGAPHPVSNLKLIKN